jgi:chemotaxis protein MotA
MFVVIGFAIVLGCVFGGYTLAGGHMGIILHALPLELLIIGGSGVGAYLIANNSHILKATLKNVTHVFAGPKYRKADYIELLSLLFVIFRTLKSKGAKGIEKDIDTPAESELFKGFPRVLKDHHAVTFVCDYLRLLVLRSENAVEIDSLMDQELSVIGEEMHHGSHALQTMADGLPALGIVAAVLGVIKTMSSISEPPAVLGGMIASALVGTFLGVFLSYGFVGPFAAKVKAIHESDLKFYQAIRAAFIAHLNGSQPAISVEFGRKVIADTVRPSFAELDEVVSKLGQNLKA